MSRGIGEFDAIQGSIPEWLAVVVALLTQLGDVWFLVLVLAVVYWIDRRDRDGVAAVAGVTLAGMGLYKGLKEVFGLPRPEEPLLDPGLLPSLIAPLYEATATAGGYGFPSGHAVNTTIVYVGLASVLSIGSGRLRYAVAAGLVALVSFTRVALGVHYVVDVVAGVAVGLALLWIARSLSSREFTDRATITFALGIGFGAFFFVTSDGASDAVFLLAAALGGFGGWQLVMLGRSVIGASSRSRTVRPLVARASGAVVAAIPLLVALEGAPLVSLSTAAAGVGLAVASAVAIPVFLHSSSVRDS